MNHAFYVREVWVFRGVCTLKKKEFVLGNPPPPLSKLSRRRLLLSLKDAIFSLKNRKPVMNPTASSTSVLRVIFHTSQRRPLLIPPQLATAVVDTRRRRILRSLLGAFRMDGEKLLEQTFSGGFPSDSRQRCMSHLRNNEKKHLKSLEETERNKITNQIFGLHTADGVYRKGMVNTDRHPLNLDHTGPDHGSDYESDYKWITDRVRD